MAYKGKYRVKNYRKYKGDPTGVIYRSLWEKKFMDYCDSNRKVIDGQVKSILFHIKIPYKRNGEDTSPIST